MTTSQRPVITSVSGPSQVFQVLRDGRSKSLAELALLSGLSRSTVRERLFQLVSTGLVGQTSEAHSTGGRPGRRMALIPDARVVLAVDLGASHMRMALVDLLNRPLTTYEEPIDITNGPEAVLQRVMGRADALLERVGRPRADLLAVGLGVPGPVHFSTGRPSRPPLMPGWDDFDIPSWFRQHLEAAVLVDNDVNIMALGEHSRLPRKTKHFMLVKVATGIGAGIISEGELQRGAQGIAGDIGHVHVPSAHGVLCHCGNEGCLEAVASGPPVARKLSRAGVHTAADVVRLVDEGDLQAIQAVRQAGRDLGEVLSACISMLNPEVIAIGGRMAGAGEHLLAGVREVVYQRAMPLATRNLDIHTAQVPVESGLIGAGLLALQEVLSPGSVDALCES
ncbi:MAG TPA: ROK family protein [Candidatus Nesterenkonia stercoripullorum]|uniref:ROK family protein n=1 Tax=Candidatus Nesterenkonia stercoripullorum TaxID=2838701 RepID=A0A9D1UUB0_9MICC|nr:ROK family protein [Candidatus Nesterenkonia stercoripullorum]